LHLSARIPEVRDHNQQRQQVRQVIRKTSKPVLKKEIQTGTVEQAFRMPEPEFEQPRAGY
jgi:hypothetical protein